MLLAVKVSNFTILPLTWPYIRLHSAVTPLQHYLLATANDLLSCNQSEAQGLTQHGAAVQDNWHLYSLL
jgi:hypothetical protein